MRKKTLEFILLFIVATFAFFIRTYNVNWDLGTHIHPDERFLTMVTNDMRLPKTPADYLNPQVSTMNPHNINYGFFVYGTFPLYLVKISAIFLKMDDYGNISIVGRVISAIFDTGIVVILFLLTRTLFHCSIVPLLRKNSHEVRNNNRAIEQSSNYSPSWAPLIPPFLYSIMVLPIQLSHFFAVDTFLAFFMVLSFYISVLIQRNISEEKWSRVSLLSVLLGIASGLGLACKVTMVFIIPLNLLVIASSFFVKNTKFKINSAVTFFTRQFVYSYIPLFFFTYLFFRFAMPMAFSTADLLNPSLNPKWIKNLVDLQNMGSSSLSNTFPPAIQWFHTPPIIYPLKNMILWGMGTPMAIICIIALILNFRFLIIDKNSKFKKLFSPLILLSLFSIAFFIYQGSQFVKAMRYFYPIYWCMALFGGIFITQIMRRFRKILIAFIILISLLIYPFSFLQIYNRQQTRVEASRWMFQNLTPGSQVTFEAWDDPLPLMVDGKINLFPGIGLPMFSPDSREKWSQIFDVIANTDYVILSSNRVYGSIPRRPDLYPLTVKYYKLLFEGKLGFEKIAEFSSRPTILILNYELVDDDADETFTVYDHPKVSIFRNVAKLDKEQLLSLIYK